MPRLSAVAALWSFAAVACLAKFNEMSVPVITALIAGLSALIGVAVNGFLTWRMAQRQREFERFKAELQSAHSTHQAVTSYRFDARRRLYLDCEPIFFQLREAAYDALRLIPRFGEADFLKRLKAQRVNMGPTDHWMLSNSSATIYALYCLIRPLGLYCILKRKITDVDLSLDDAVLFRYRLARELYKCFYEDSELARSAPSLDYDPLVANWREMRAAHPAKHWWQGASPGRLENGIACLVAEDRVISFGEFEEIYQTAYEDRASPLQKRLGLLANPLYDFRPEERPVFWRALVVKAHLYAALLKPIPSDIDAISRSPEKLRTFLRLPEDVARHLDDVSRGTPLSPALADADFGLSYLSARLQAPMWIR